MLKLIEVCIYIDRCRNILLMEKKEQLYLNTYKKAATDFGFEIQVSFLSLFAVTQ